MIQEYAPRTTIRYESQFARFLECTVQHSYYRSGNSADLHFAPTPETAHRLQQYGLLYRASAFGFVLLRNWGKDLSGGVYDGPISLVFRFKSHNPAFLQFTDIPFSTNQVHSLRNVQSDGGLVHPGAFVDEQTRTDQEGDGFQGLLELVLNEDNRHFGTGSAVAPEEPMLFDIRFKARQARWSYLCYGDHNLLDARERWQVVSRERDGESLTFPAAEPDVLGNGQAALRLTSMQELPMLERYNHQYELKIDRGAGGSPYTRVLPHPHPGQLRYDNEASLFYSEIILKL